MPLTQMILIILETIGVVDKLWIYFTIAFNFFYTFELVLKLLCHSAFGETFIEFFLKLNSIVEVLSVMDIWLEIDFLWNSEMGEPPNIYKTFRVFSLLRLIRLLKFKIFSANMIVLFDAIKGSAQVLLILIVVTSLSMLVMANFIFYTEEKIAPLIEGENE